MTGYKLGKTVGIPMERILVIWAMSLGSVLACGPALSPPHMASVQLSIHQAKQLGARRCAPQALAIAVSQYQFAQLEAQQGFPSRAGNHLWQAERHALAAQLLSADNLCTAVRRESAPTSNSDTPVNLGAPTGAEES